MSGDDWTHCTMEEIAAHEPNALCIGPFGSDLLASDLVESGVPVVFVRNVRPGAFNHAEMRFVTHAKADALRAHKVRSGDIVVTKMGLPPCIAAGYPTTAPDGIVTADIIKLTPDKKRADSRFIVYFLNSPIARAQVSKFTFGVTRPKVTLKDFRNLRLLLPPLPEQRRIADILDKADAIRRKRKQAIALTEQLLRSTFLEMFGDPVTNPKGWPVKPLGELADIASGVAKGKNYEAQATATVPYMRVANVQDGHLVLDEIKTITVSQEESRRYQLAFGDVLLTEGGDPDKLGRGSVWRNEVPNCIHQNHIFRVRPSNEIMSDLGFALT